MDDVVVVVVDGSVVVVDPSTTVVVVDGSTTVVVVEDGSGTVVVVVDGSTTVVVGAWVVGDAFFSVVEVVASVRITAAVVVAVSRTVVVVSRWRFVCSLRSSDVAGSSSAFFVVDGASVSTSTTSAGSAGGVRGRNWSVMAGKIDRAGWVMMEAPARLLDTTMVAATPAITRAPRRARAWADAAARSLRLSAAAFEM